ncbi:MAG TPA: GtrA family protein [bacterium]|nr:GtrA family protein [bacterium]
MLTQIINLIWHHFFLKFKQFFKFCVVGTTGAIIDIGGLWLLVEFVGLYYLVGATISFVAAVINNYFLNKYWTFKDQSKISLAQFFSFSIISVIGLGINLLTMYIFVECVNLNYLISKAIASLIVLSWNFLMNKYITFKKSYGPV